MRYAESLHEIVLEEYIMIQGHLMTSPKCVHHVHVTQTTGYHSILTILIQIFLIFSPIHILFSEPLFCFLRCVQIQRKILCFHFFLFDKYKT